MRQRLGLAQALMEDPDILMLDEPLSGLDNDGVQEMYRVLLGEKEKGKLIVIASHSKEDIATLCDEIYRFDKGTVIEHEVLVKEKSRKSGDETVFLNVFPEFFDMLSILF